MNKNKNKSDSEDSDDQDYQPVLEDSEDSISEEDEPDTRSEKQIASDSKQAEEIALKKTDLLWDDFLKDVGPRPGSNTKLGPSLSSDNLDFHLNLKGSSKLVPNQSYKQNDVAFSKCLKEPIELESQINLPIKTLLDSASKDGQHTETLKNSDKPTLSLKRPAGSGLTSILDRISKAPKFSTLDKSKLDWEEFKQREGIAEQLQTINRGKDGYLERQAFLGRADLRQFENEKAMRSLFRRQGNR